MASFAPDQVDHFQCSWNDSITIAYIRIDGTDYLPGYHDGMHDGYMMPPNHQWPPREPGFFSDTDGHGLRHNSPYYPGQPSSVSPLVIRGFSNSSTSTSTTADSLSPRPSEEMQGFDEGILQSFGRIGSPQMPGTIYSSPTVSHSSIPNECRGVTPREIQQVPDTIPEESLPSMNPVANLHMLGDGTMHVDSPQMIDTGLPTPASETVTPTGEEDHVMQPEDDSDSVDNSGDYKPSQRTRSKKTKASSPKAATKSKSRTHRVNKSISKTTKAIAASPKKLALPSQCSHCGEDLGSKTACEKHVQSAHTRPFSCIFERYGCKATFGAKNEWKRHCSTQHLRLIFYRCDVGACVPQNAQKLQHQPGWDLPIAAPANCNDFNRKDLFIQHHRRMHAPDGIDERSEPEKDKFKALCEKAALRCRVSARAPPPRTICGLCQTKGCPVVFEGARAWETRMEHVGRHLESAKGEQMEWAEDLDLKNWLIDEGLIQRTSRGDWKLTDHMRADEGRVGRR